MTLLLLAVGFFAVLGFEWNNPGTLGPLDTPGKLLASFFQGVQPRTAGFNSLNYGAMEDETLLVSTALMIIGAGSASTGGRDQGDDDGAARADGVGRAAG